MITPREYFKKYKCYSRLIKFLEEKSRDYIDKPMEWWDCDHLHTWYLKNMQYDCYQYAKNVVIPVIKQQRKDIKRRNNIVFDGLRDYNYMICARSLKSAPDRNCRYLKGGLIQVISDSLFEYFIYTDEELTTLKINAMTDEEVERCGLFQVKAPIQAVVICLKNSFWKGVGIDV